MALAPTTGSLIASTTESVEITSTPLPVQHIVIKTMKPYPEVKARVEKLGRLDDSIRALLTKNDVEGLRTGSSVSLASMALRSIMLHSTVICWR